MTSPGIRPLPFEEWLAGVVENVADAARMGLAESLGDIDGDGTRDFEEFFLGMDPLKQDVPAIRPEFVIDENGAGHLAICFQRRKDAGIDAFVEASANLHQWNASPDLFDQIRVADLGNGIEEIVVCLRETAGQAPNSLRFLRLRMSMPQP